MSNIAPLIEVRGKWWEVREYLFRFSFSSFLFWACPHSSHLSPLTPHLSLCRICNPAVFSIRICNPLSFSALQMLILIVVGLQIRPSGVTLISESTLKSPKGTKRSQGGVEPLLNNHGVTEEPRKGDRDLKNWYRTRSKFCRPFGAGKLWMMKDQGLAPLSVIYRTFGAFPGH